MQYRRIAFSSGTVFAACLLLGASGTTPSFEARILAAHNVERARMGTPSLRWDPGLAAAAQSWADKLAATGELEHARADEDAPQGENLWEGTKGAFTPEDMVNSWIEEKKYYRPGIFPHNSTTGKFEDVGHYTQVIWRATDHVGCALASSARDDILVCRYSVAGNTDGETPI